MRGIREKRNEGTRRAEHACKRPNLFDGLWGDFGDEENGLGELSLPTTMVAVKNKPRLRINAMVVEKVKGNTVIA
ncbi:hypothetical protein VNO77_34346 [Canavalia gladiata]|uniref:Uncharacterized protein n=1 Tax=Canavalia gladiata TaxID=3824 RepID=A0AAN9KGK1_CANGL